MLPPGIPVVNISPAIMRIAFFAGAYDSILDGVSLTSNRQVQYLLDQGEEVRVYAPTGPVRVLEPAGTLISVPSIGFPGNPYRLALGLTPATRQDLNLFRPDLVHLASPDWLGFAALLWSQRRQIPVVSTFHTHFCHYLQFYHLALFEPLAWKYLRAFYRRCDRVSVATESLAQELKEQQVDARFFVNPFGVDTHLFSPRFRSQDWRARLGIGPEERVILFVGRLVWEKGLRVWAEVIQRLEADGIPHRSLVVGEGPAGPALQKMLPRTHFSGRLASEELSTAFASSDLFFFPSASETFGCVTVEALASGLPCVVVDAVGSRDIIRNGQEGLVCRVDDGQDCYVAIVKLLSQPELCAEMRRIGLFRATEFSWNRVLSRMHQEWRTVQDEKRLPNRLFRERISQGYTR